mmetsp:Transcript_49694/g.94965  ORF Transcript_49694/g.94965 Transcript_49694/m.94965 type:complete len:303 (-) Transcript_49694:106-1014(-)
MVLSQLVHDIVQRCGHRSKEMPGVLGIDVAPSLNKELHRAPSTRVGAQMNKCCSHVVHDVDALIANLYFVEHVPAFVRRGHGVNAQKVLQAHVVAFQSKRHGAGVVVGPQRRSRRPQRGALARQVALPPGVQVSLPRGASLRRQRTRHLLPRVPAPPTPHDAQQLRDARRGPGGGEHLQARRHALPVLVRAKRGASLQVRVRAHQHRVLGLEAEDGGGPAQQLRRALRVARRRHVHALGALAQGLNRNPDGPLPGCLVSLCMRQILRLLAGAHNRPDDVRYHQEAVPRLIQQLLHVLFVLLA